MNGARSLGVAVITALIAAAALAGSAAAQRQPLDLPVVVIDAPQGIVDEPKRTATMRVFDRDRREDYNGQIGIELRGLSSQRDPKKSYAVETQDSSGDNRNVPLLGMPEDDDWVLIANYKDESLLRNHVVYSTARWTGHYAARTRFVEVVLNNSYEGVYVLAEGLKLHENRIAVDDSEVSGGYLLEMTSPERTAGEQFFTTPVERKPIFYDDPSREDLSFRRANWIRRYVNRVERRLYSDEFRDRQRGYRRVLDIDAAVDYLLLNELFRNNDTFRVSTYMYKSVDEKLVLGPLWDFDHAIGNSGAAEPNLRTGWHYGTFPWAERLYADRRFRRKLYARWKELRDQGLERKIMRTIDRGARSLNGGPQERNFSRWPTFERDRDRQPPDPRTGAPPANYAQAVDYLKWWIGERFNWMNGQIEFLSSQ